MFFRTNNKLLFIFNKTIKTNNLFLKHVSTTSYATTNKPKHSIIPSINKYTKHSNKRKLHYLFPNTNANNNIHLNNTTKYYSIITDITDNDEIDMPKVKKDDKIDPTLILTNENENEMVDQEDDDSAFEINEQDNSDSDENNDGENNINNDNDSDTTTNTKRIRKQKLTPIPKLLIKYAENILHLNANKKDIENEIIQNAITQHLIMLAKKSSSATEALIRTSHFFDSMRLESTLIKRKLFDESFSADYTANNDKNNENDGNNNDDSGSDDSDNNTCNLKQIFEVFNDDTPEEASYNFLRALSSDSTTKSNSGFTYDKLTGAITFDVSIRESKKLNKQSASPSNKDNVYDDDDNAVTMFGTGVGHSITRILESPVARFKAEERAQVQTNEDKTITDFTFDNDTQPLTPLQYEILIELFCNNNKINEARKLLEEVKFRGETPTIGSYYWIISALDRRDFLDIAREYFREMLSKRVQLEPTIEIYNALLRGYCKRGKLSEAVTLMYLMLEKESNGITKITSSTYFILFEAYCRFGNTNMANKILLEMKKRKLPITSDFFTCLLRASGEQLSLPTAQHVLNVMDYLGIRENLKTKNAMIQVYCKTNDFDAAIDMLANIKNQGSPNSFSYIPIIRGLCAQERTHEARQLLLEMRSLVHKQNSQPYLDVIRSYCKLGNIEEARCLMELMKESGLNPDAATMHLISSFTTKQFEKAKEKIYDNLLLAQNKKIQSQTSSNVHNNNFHPVKE